MPVSRRRRKNKRAHGADGNHTPPPAIVRKPAPQDEKGQPAAPASPAAGYGNAAVAVTAAIFLAGAAAAVFLAGKKNEAPDARSLGICVQSTSVLESDVPVFSLVGVGGKRIVAQDANSMLLQQMLFMGINDELDKARMKDVGLLFDANGKLVGQFMAGTVMEQQAPLTDAQVAVLSRHDMSLTDVRGKLTRLTVGYGEHFTVTSSKTFSIGGKNFAIADYAQVIAESGTAVVTIAGKTLLFHPRSQSAALSCE